MAPPVDGLYDGTVAADDRLTNEPFTSIPKLSPRRLLAPFLILLLSLGGFAVMGYHPGFEDDGIYLSAVKADLNPALFPHDADFFRLQTQATLFVPAMSAFVRLTRIPLPWAEMLGQFLSLFGILWAAWRIAVKLFPEQRAQWAGVAFLAAMFTLPASGTALNLVDQHLHPRNIATALILFAIERTLTRKPWQMAPLLVLALLMHPIMGCFGISFCLFLTIVLTNIRLPRPTSHLAPYANLSLIAAFPLGWIFEPPSPDWRRALATRTYYFLYKWTWYEWLGAIGPLILFWLAHRYAARRQETLLARFSLALVLYGVFQQCIAMILLAPAALVRLTPLQPMRYLHLEYVFLALVAGALLGRHVLGGSPWRWALFLLLANGGMFLSQRLLLPGSEHLEWPGRTTHNPWLQAFVWIRENTPTNAYFALDPGYLALPGEDYHCFRALAERSQLADAVKDSAVVTQVPELASRWAMQVDAQAGWNGFQLAAFENLRSRFGGDWVLVSYPPPNGIDCLWHNGRLSVCRIPAITPR